MWLKKLKKKKFQFLLVMLMLCFTSVIFSACISFTAETAAYTKDYVSYKNCPKIITISHESYNDEFFSQYSDMLAKTTKISYANATITEHNLNFGDKELKTALNIFYHIDSVDSYMHTLKIIDGEGNAPAYGEIWINSVTADSYGVNVGDVIKEDTNGGREFKVGGIVATLVSPSPYMGVQPYYVSSETAELLGGTDVKCCAFYSNEEMSSADYMDLLPEDVKIEALHTVSSNDINTSISYLATIFGSVGIIAAVIVFAVSLIVIRFIIISTLAKEYVEIGTYKALGFKENEILGFYLKSFSAAGIVGIVLGAALSFPISWYLCDMVLHNLGSFELTVISLVTSVCVCVLLAFLLSLGVLTSLHKIRKITPVEAFGVNNPSSKKKIGKSLIKSAYSSLAVAVNEIVRRKRANIMTVAVLTVSFYMTTLFLSLNYSLQRMDQMTGEWFTFPQYSAIISTSGKDAAIESFFDHSELVDRYLYCNIDIDMSGLRSDDDIDLNDVYIEAYSDCSENALGLPLLSGRHPETKDEILVSYDFAAMTGLNNGDWFHLENDSYSNDYLITGIFSSMYNGGKNMIIDGEEFKNFGKPDRYKSLLVFAANGVSYDELEKSVKEAINDVSITKTISFLEGSIQSLNSVSKPLTTLFAVIFSLFSLLNIINLLVMNNIENRREYGILKAMGFTNGYICRKNLLRVGILTAVSAALSILLDLFFSQRIVFTVIHVNGLISNPQLTATVTAILFAVIMFTTAAFTIPLRKISPTYLMEE